MRLFLLILLCLLSTGTLALKGGRVRGETRAADAIVGRLLQEPKGPKEGGPKEGHGPKEVHGPKEAGGPKIAKKGDKKADPKKAEKKCKKAKKAKKGPLKDEGEVPPPPVHPPDAVPENLPYCLHGKLTAEECEAMKRGKAPKGDKSISGDLNLEISYEDDSSSEQVLEKVENVLRKETPSMFVGCDMRRRRLDEENSGAQGEFSPTEDDLSVTGVDFGAITVLSEDCSSKGDSDSDTKCDNIAADAKIFYEGKDDPTREEEQDMFNLLKATIESQAKAGAFGDIGTVENVDSGPGGSSSTTGGSSSGGGSSAGLPVGVVVGVLAVVAAAAGGVMYKRRIDARDSEKGEDTSDSDEEIPVAEAILVDDGKDNKYKGKK